MVTENRGYKSNVRLKAKDLGFQQFRWDEKDHE